MNGSRTQSNVRSHISPDVNAAADACARHIAALLEQALAERRSATLAISGGAGPRPMFERLAAIPLVWRNVHIFWVDERAVPPADERSNYKLAEESLIRPARIPGENVHRIRGEMKAEAAALAYAGDIRAFFKLDDNQLPVFDVVHLGLGENAHTASLFPGDPLIDDRSGIAAAAHVDAEPPWRVTLLPGVLLAARHIAAHVTGAGKAEAVRAVFREPFDPNKYPAQLAHRGHDTVWFMDAAAARLLSAE